MPDFEEVVRPTFVPGTRNIPLVGDAGVIPVIDVELCVAVVGEGRNLDPSHQHTIFFVVILDLVM